MIKSSKWPGALIQLHLAIFLWGFTAILGKWISLGEFELVWLRIYMTIPMLTLFPALWGELRRLQLKHVALLLGIGAIVAIHWIFFYGAIKRSNASITLSTFATTAVFTALLEPFIFKKKLSGEKILFGLLACLGIYLILQASFQYAIGIIWGLLAAFTSALFSSFNKKIIAGKGSYAVTFVEMIGALLFLSIFYPLITDHTVSDISITSIEDLGGLLLLSFLCTAIPFVLSLNALRHVSAFTANLSLNLEPVYGIVMAMIFFRENQGLTLGFYLGTVIIVGSVFLHSYMETRASKRIQQA